MSGGNHKGLPTAALTLGAGAGGRASPDLFRQLGAYDDPPALVKSVDEADQRRLTIVQCLAQAARWDEMREVLRGVKSPNEACDVAWFTASALENENATLE